MNFKWRKLFVVEEEEEKEALEKRERCCQNCFAESCRWQNQQLAVPGSSLFLFLLFLFIFLFH